MFEEKSLEQIRKMLEEIQTKENFTPDENYQKELDMFINEAFGQDFENELMNKTKTQKLKVRKINPDAILPKYNYSSDSGFDLHSVDEIIIPAFGRALVPTGLSFQFPEGFEIQMRPKSGLAINQGLTILNTPGTIDQGYSGEVKAIVFNTNDVSYTISKGMKIAQAVLCPVVNGKYVEIEEVEVFEETDRKDNGFGSTGIK